ncbi:MAG TPA: hypothetical protein VFB82_16930 [Blastocatellia bacterium]|jgi:hypothetical protein|nr:hypothetical protein [Blastocatellia bacterium]
MTKLRRIGISCAPMVVFICALSISAQWNKKPYTEWSEKDVKKVLNDSPWGQTQVYSDTSNEFKRGVSRNALGTTDNSTGDYSATHLNIRIRLLSSKPVRQAFSRLIAMTQKGAVSEQLNAQLKGFVDRDPGQYVVVAVDADANESKSEIREFRTLMDSRALADLKQNTYLSGKGGERVYIIQYLPPQKDNLGAKFVFPRLVNGEPFVGADTNELRFYSEFSEKFKLDMRFKVKDMLVEGKLEY